MEDAVAVLAEIHSLVEAQAYDAAIKLATEFLEKAAESAAVLRARSGAFASSGRLAEARADATRSLELEPANLDYAIHCASLAVASGRHQEAIQLLQDRIGNGGNGAAERVLSGAWAASGEFRRALHFAEIAIERQPNHAEFRMHRDGLKQHAERNMRISREKATVVSAPSVRAPASSLRVHGRVLYALVLREVAGQYERSRLGYLWAIIEPIVHLMVLGLFFSLLNHSTAPLGHNLYLFYLTGLLPFFMIIHTGSKVMHGISANRSLLLLPPIKVLDILVARGLLSLLTELLVAVLILGIFNILGISAVPENSLLTLGALLLAWFFGISLGILMAVLSEIFESWEMIWSQITRVMYFCSGIFYVAEKMPPRIRAVLIWNPILQCIELLRSGFYSGFTPPWLEPGYVMLAAMVLLAAGGLLLNLFARHIGAEE
jgi:capsular polysaccharide transport system permease protein